MTNNKSQIAITNTRITNPVAMSRLLNVDLQEVNLSSISQSATFIRCEFLMTRGISSNTVSKLSPLALILRDRYSY